MTRLLKRAVNVPRAGIVWRRFDLFEELCRRRRRTQAGRGKWLKWFRAPSHYHKRRIHSGQPPRQRRFGEIQSFGTIVSDQRSPDKHHKVGIKTLYGLYQRIISVRNRSIILPAYYGRRNVVLFCCCKKCTGNNQIFSAVIPGASKQNDRTNFHDPSISSSKTVSAGISMEARRPITSPNRDGETPCPGRFAVNISAESTSP